MFKHFLQLAVLIFISMTSSTFAAGCNSCFGDCCQTLEFGLGWRRDFLNWKVDRLTDSYVDALVNSHIEFEKIDMYTAYAQAKWYGEAYYVRLKADYGTTIKGRAEEHFNIHSPLLGGTVDVFTNNPIKRRSEVYDFIGAVGYPLVYDCYRLNVFPLIGFSFHRQRVRVKDEEHSSPSFIVDSSNPFGFAPSFSSGSSDSFGFFQPFISDPFSDESDPVIHSALGLSAEDETSVYRFTWYGFFIGADIAYALDPCWTLFTELEWHFYDRCHQKRKSTTGVYFVDRYHHKGWANGFNGTVGTVWDAGNCWFATATVDFKYWLGHGDHNKLKWKSAGANLSLIYRF